MESFRQRPTRPMDVTKRTLCRRLAMMFAFLGWIAPGTSVESGEIIERARAAWREREARITSFAADWAEIAVPLTALEGRDDDGRPLPGPDLIHTTHFHMACDGEKARLNRSGPDYSIDFHGYIEKSFTRVFDGVERKEVFQSESMGYRPGGFLNDDRRFDGGDWRIQPLVLAFRPTKLAMGAPDLTLWQETGRRETVNGIDCDVLDWERAPTVLERLAIAREGDSRAIRRTLLIRGKAIDELTIDWEERPNEGFVCRGWTRVEKFEDGTSSRIGVVAELKLMVNRSIDASEFDYRFPAGTVVTHERTKAMAIVRKDGSYRTILPAEWRAAKSLGELMESDPLPEAEPFVRDPVGDRVK